MDRTCILIRVYNRVEDLRYCLEIIRNTWIQIDYYIILVSNGINDGHLIDATALSRVDKFIQVENNVGHFSGNSQLLLEGLPYIPANCKYTVILEADTWIYGDDLIKKYTRILDDLNAVWASAQFFRYVENLATDFAIINTSFLLNHREIFIFSSTPEYHIANYLLKACSKYVFIKENMPISLPRYVKKYPHAPTGRFFSFERSKMVTHHIENYKNGMEQKKLDFNVISGTNYFRTEEGKLNKLSLVSLRFFKWLSFFLPYKGWFIKRKFF